MALYECMCAYCAKELVGTFLQYLLAWPDWRIYLVVHEKENNYQSLA
jgi:hypothetical protein